MSNWDWSSPWLYLGAACLLAAIVGGGITALGYTIPILHSRLRQALLAIFGIVLIVVPQVVQSIDASNKKDEAKKIAEQQERDKLKIDGVLAEVDPSHYWGCNDVEVHFTATIRASGKTGEIPVASQVVVTELHPEIDPSQQSVYDHLIPVEDFSVIHGGTTPITGSTKISILPGAANVTGYQLIYRLLSPDRMESEPASFSIECTQGTPQ
jgi:hypothetical protein